ncbi:hypothetical protein D3C75_1168530 [compost metagenome]
MHAAVNPDVISSSMGPFMKEDMAQLSVIQLLCDPLGQDEPRIQEPEQGWCGCTWGLHKDDRFSGGHHLLAFVKNPQQPCIGNHRNFIPGLTGEP